MKEKIINKNAVDSFASYAKTVTEADAVSLQESAMTLILHAWMQ